MDKQLLEELNRNREIMGLNHLIFEQSDFVLGIEREKECPCMDDNGIPDGTTAPVCCNEWSEEDSELMNKLSTGYSTGEIPTIKNKYRGMPGLKELENAYLDEYIKLFQEYIPKLDAEVKADPEMRGYGSLNNYRGALGEMLNVKKMGPEEFAKLSLMDQVMFARNKEEYDTALEKWTVKKIASDKRYEEKWKNIRIQQTQQRDEDFEELRVSTKKLYKAFYKKLDRQSKKRWNNKDKAYNEKGWVMTEEDKRGLFQLFKEYFQEWREMKRNKKRAAKLSDLKLLKKFFSEINVRNVKGPDEVINLEPIETEGEEPSASCALDLGLQLMGVQDKEFTPFVNNSTELHQDLKNEINGAVATLAKALKENPGVEYKITSYKILTSASRARNGGAVKSWSFQKLSDARAKSVETYIDNAFAKIGVTLPEPQIDSSGYNNDGSSGPNPPSPFTMAKGSGPAATTNEDDRDKYGDPLPCKPTDGKFICPNYDKYKYCMVDLGIEVYPPEVDSDEEPGDPGTYEFERIVSPTRQWEIKFVPKEKYSKGSSRRLKFPFKFTTRRINRSPKKKKPGSLLCPDFSGGGGGGRWAVGIATGPLIDDVVNNNMASYNTNWMSN